MGGISIFLLAGNTIDKQIIKLVTSIIDDKSCKAPWSPEPNRVVPFINYLPDP
ncbi:MAG: hypothetical protein ACI9LM_005628 [Alteromonadaceae bacterium]